MYTQQLVILLNQLKAMLLNPPVGPNRFGPMIAFYLRIFENRAVDLLGESEMVLSNEVEAEFRDFCRIYFGNLVPIPNPTNNLLGGSLGDCNFIFGAFNVNALPVQIFYFDDVRTGFTFVTVRDHLSEGRRFPPPPV